MAGNPEKAQSKRWLEIVYMGSLSAGIFLLSLWIFRHRLSDVTVTPIWAGASLIACVLVISVYGHKRTVPFFGWRHFLNYPPIWTASLLGGSIAFLLLGYLPSIVSSLGLFDVYPETFQKLGWVTFLVLYIFCFVRVLWELPKKDGQNDIPAVEKHKTTPLIFVSFSDLIAWLDDDLPIKNEEGAAFGHVSVAKRMASRMVDKKHPSQALVGQFGSGKTSMLHLVEDALKFENGGSRIKIVPVELWPYETPRAAVEGVLGKIIRALSEEVEVIGLRGLPGSYTEAMSSLGGFWSALARLQGIPSNPFDTLTRIDEIATAIGLTYIIWVEDLERFADGGPEPESQKGLERLNPIRALLYGLDSLESVSVVAATTSLNLSFDLEKIARFVEKVPEIGKLEASNILACFRDGCYSRTIIDPATKEARRKLSFTTDPEQFEQMVRLMNLDKDVYGADQALLFLSKTPRTLKQGLRKCFDTWKRLAGEIDFDDLLVMSILCEAEPGAFALIDKFIFDLRAKNSDIDARESFRNALGTLQIDVVKKEAVNEIVKFVFDEGGKPQGLAKNGHADYWKRSLSVPKIESDKSDQRVLRIMGTEDDQKLLDLIENPAYSDAVEDFADVVINGEELLSTQRRLRLFIPWVERRCEATEKDWADKTPGFIPLWRLWVEKSRRGSINSIEALALIKQAYDIAVPKKLALVAEIEHFYVVPDGVQSILADSKDAKCYLRKLFYSTYVDKPDQLAQTLEGTDPRTLAWLCWGLDRIRANDNSGEPFEGWEHFAKTLLEAARSHPEIMLPQLACLVVDEHPTPPWENGQHTEFNAKLTSQLFGSLDDFLFLFRNDDLTMGERDARVKTVILEAKKLELTNSEVLK